MAKGLAEVFRRLPERKRSAVADSAAYVANLFLGCFYATLGESLRPFKILLYPFVCSSASRFRLRA